METHCINKHLQDDLEVSPDFLTYFKSLSPLLFDSRENLYWKGFYILNLYCIVYKLYHISYILVICYNIYSIIYTNILKVFRHGMTMERTGK